MTKEAIRLGLQPINATMNFQQNCEALEHAPYDIFTHPGITKREYFAGLAMQGMVSNKDIDLAVGESVLSRKQVIEDYAQTSLRLADALLEKLAKTE